MKKFICFLLIGVLAVTMLCGCNDGTEPTELTGVLSDAEQSRIAADEMMMSMVEGMRRALSNYTMHIETEITASTAHSLVGNVSESSGDNQCEDRIFKSLISVDSTMNYGHISISETASNRHYAVVNGVPVDSSVVENKNLKFVGKEVDAYTALHNNRIIGFVDTSNGCEFMNVKDRYSSVNFGMMTAVFRGGKTYISQDGFFIVVGCEQLLDNEVVQSFISVMSKHVFDCYADDIAQALSSATVIVKANRSYEIEYIELQCSEFDINTSSRIFEILDILEEHDVWRTTCSIKITFENLGNVLQESVLAPSEIVEMYINSCESAEQANENIKKYEAALGLSGDSNSNN